MTTTPAPSISVFPLSGSMTGPFATGWKYGTAEDVRAWLELGGVRQPDLVLGADFTLTGANPAVDGGTVTLSAALTPAAGWAEGDRLVLRRRTVKRQALALPDAEGHKPKSTEQALDKLMRTAEEADDQLELAVKAPPGETGPQLPPAASRAGKIAWFNGTAVGAYQIAPGQVLGAHPETGLPVSIPPVFAVDSTPAQAPSRLAAMLMGFVETLTFVRTAGYDAVGDGGGGLYKRVGAEPAHHGKFQSADGAWWELTTDAPNVLQFGARRDDDPASAAINAEAFYRAGAYKAGVVVFVPEGEYYSNGIGLLAAAGVSYRGAGRWRTILKPGPTLTAQTDAIFYNFNAAVGTSAYGSISEIGFELQGQDCTAINLDGVNNYSVRRCRCWGGSDYASAAGVLVRFDATLDSAAYANRVQDCDGRYLYATVVWGEGANHNTVDGGEATLCIKGYDANPGGIGVDTPRILNVRTEGCNIGIDDGATQGFYSGVRSENNALCDFRLTAASDHPAIIGGYTAVTANPLLGLDAATMGYSIQSDDLGWFEAEPSLSRVRRFSMRQAFYAPGVDLLTAPILNGDWALYLGGTTIVRRGFGLEFVNADDDNTLIGVATSGNTLVISGYDRKNAGYGPIDIGGGGSVRPITDNGTSCGTAGRRWSEVFAGNATINTSDERLKQDVAELTAAEAAVAQALKGLIRTFRWKDAVAEKGDAARIHVGVVAQHVIAAFEAQGLDPFRYAMVCHDAWEAEPEQWSEPTWGEEPVLYEGGEPVLYAGGELVRGPDYRAILTPEGEEQYRQAGEPVLDAEGQPVLRQAGEPVLDARGRPVTRRVVIAEPVLLRPATPAGERYSIRYEEMLAFIIGALP